jgi:Protein of unknown function (DUF3572)
LALGPKKQRVDLAYAEALAAEGLGFLADDENRLIRFMTETGMDPGALHASADTREVLLAVLDHIGSDESLLLVFAASRSVKPETVMEAAVLLQGRPHERST